MTKRCWSIYVHDPDGDMGEGVVIGPMTTGSADRRAQEIREMDNDLECIILYTVGASVNPSEVINLVRNES